jgi:hypothetical protein
MKVRKTDMELATALYTNKAGISRLLSMSHQNACGIFGKAQEIERAELGNNYIDRTKVRVSTVLRIAGISRDELIRSIKERNEQA